MKLEVFDDAGSVARVAAANRRGCPFGNRCPWPLCAGSQWRSHSLDHAAGLSNEDVPWVGVHVFQVDERVAPEGHSDRNLTYLRERLLQHAPLCPEQIHAMPVELLDLQTASTLYGRTLREIAGTPPVLDLVHLGLGPDGHTASLVPGDAVLEVMDADVAPTGAYQGRCRMTLTYPMLNRARRVLWVVTGSEKAEMLRRLRDGDVSIPSWTGSPRTGHGAGGPRGSRTAGGRVQARWITCA